MNLRSRLARISALCGPVVVIGHLMVGTMVLAQSSGDDLGLYEGVPVDQLIPPTAGTPRGGDAGKDDVDFDPVTGCVVRVAYIIPSNRITQTNGIEKLVWGMRQLQEWYADQMERHGFPGKYPRVETEADGVTPKIYVVPVAVTDEYLRGDLWGRTISAATAAGVPAWASKQVWLLVSEAHVQAPSGGISGGTALGASFGSGDDPGVGMVGGDALARFSPEYLTNNGSYGGVVIPAIGPYPLVEGISFPWFEGSTLSSVSSSILGAAVHELSHAFGLPHDFRNDKNFSGNLMGNGLRGIRGNLYPLRYRTDYTRISYGAALALSVSRYFNPPRLYTDNTKPVVSILTRGTNAPSGGLLEIHFAASDAGGLHGAWLQFKGDLVAEMALSGFSTNATFATPYYNPGQADNYTISVFDRQGNKRTADTTIVPHPIGNRAPQPFVTLSTATIFAGQNVSLNAAESSDPGGSSSALQVEWDLDGDQIFDTSPTLTKFIARSFLEAGDRFIFARVTDASGASAISAPLALRVDLPRLGLSRYGEEVEISWPVSAAGWVLESARAIAPVEWSASQLPVIVRQDRFTVLTTNAVEGPGWFFRLGR